ncbi:regulatory protein NPR5-like isoform X2 [Salvia hispanica]|uniref:regulatory protein NPR5-like isoform X2 n=1 Tax=Salvia hispanica TaxID=49212 RepID=UPI0020095C6E|nr:regulatory protein NPR5-like isoform X2 [Salvia hispanica]
MSPEESLRSLSLDYLNLLINGQAFSDVTFSVEGRMVHAHRCILAARSLFFRKFFCGPDAQDPLRMGPGPASSPRGPGPAVIPVNSVGYEVFLLMLQFLYSGQVSIVPQKHEPRPNCGERGCWHTHCTSAVDLALDTLAAARSFGVEQLALLTQEMHQLWTTCSHLVGKSGLPPEVLAKHLPIDVVAKIEELRLKSSLARRSLMPHQHHQQHDHLGEHLDDQKIRRMRRALDSSDVELVKLMVMGEGLNLDEALALHYAVENCSREVVKALLELGAADVNYPAGPAGKTPLHVAADMVSPDMVAVLLDHHADPNVRTVDGITPLDVLRTLTSDFLFKGAVPGLTHIEPNKLRLCLELVQSAAMVISREEGNVEEGTGASASIYPPMSGRDQNLDSRMVYLKMSEGEETSSHGSQREAAINRHDASSMYHHQHQY